MSFAKLVLGALGRLDVDSTVPNDFLCPISLMIMWDPVTIEDGCSYEREQIEEHFKISSLSPKTGEMLKSKTIIPNHTLKSVIRSFLEQNIKARKDVYDMLAVHSDTKEKFMEFIKTQQKFGNLVQVKAWINANQNKYFQKMKEWIIVALDETNHRTTIDFFLNIGFPIQYKIDNYWRCSSCRELLDILLWKKEVKFVADLIKTYNKNISLNKSWFLYHAILSKDLETVKYAIQQVGVFTLDNIVDSKSNISLFYYCFASEIFTREIVGYLLKINYKNFDKQFLDIASSYPTTIARLACFIKQWDILQLLIEHGAMVSEIWSGTSCLQCVMQATAVDENNSCLWNVLELLLRKDETNQNWMDYVEDHFSENARKRFQRLYFALYGQTVNQLRSDVAELQKQVKAIQRAMAALQPPHNKQMPY